MEANGPQVTALLPVKHYHPRFLEEAIRSVVQQSPPDWRLLIIVEDATGARLALAVQAAADRRERLARVTRSFLRQCLFRSYVDKWIKELRGYDARQGWRERYR